MDRKALDKFYTSDVAAKSFIDFINSHIDITKFDNIIEPSAGAGALLNHLPSRAIGVDLMPERDDIIKSDFFDYTYPTGSTITVGNPPFGNRSKLAIDFFNRAAEYSDVIAFIIPVTWEKYSIHKQLAEGWALRASERLPEASFVLGDKPYKVRCCMQLWVRGEAPESSLRHLSQPTGDNPWFDFVKRDECEFAIRQAYPKTVAKEDIDGQSHYFIKPKVAGVREVFDSFNWQSEENRKMLGGASVPCLDKHTIVKFYEKYADLRKTAPPTLYDHPFEMKIGLQTSDNDYFIGHPEAKHKGFKASTMTHTLLLYPYSVDGEWDGTHKEYGRRQGLDQLGVEKIAIAPMLDGAKELRWEKLGEDVIVYSGYYLIGDLDYAEQLLSTGEFHEHLKKSGEPILNGWVKVQKSDVYSFPNLRKTEAEPTTHPDFLIKQGLVDGAEFVIRGVRPQVSTDLTIFDRIDPATRYYSVVPLVDGVKEVFDKVWWSKYWQGTSMPTVSISDCIEIYNKEKQHGCNPA